VKTEGVIVYSCNTIARAREIILVVNQVGVAGALLMCSGFHPLTIQLAILATRIIALYNNSYTAIIGVVGVALTLAGITSVSLSSVLIMLFSRPHS
jgi:hypothetical protein